ncbi:extended synaptotagmin-like protein 2a [Helobdella robusta]|uniref:Extended synaptotagmin-like protein 2a n=1 Tax=Helobdella robusta TaxID=6412 RepID=T1FFK6_HELRO|nr:extended synaptotagmin-like protein 2a [Helobdella robusta]ESN94049.1 extended synaptotagmin-like protein 2a [Helobdella robusta]
MSAVDDYHTLLLAKREKLNKGNDGSLISLILKGFKTTGIAIAVWCWGYLGMSVAWIFVLLFFHIVSEEVTKQIKSKRRYALQAMCSEKGAILSRVDKSHASWIYFPEVERAEWLNKMVKQLWPVIAEYVENLIVTTIQDSIQGYMPANLGVFKFNNVDMGDIPIRIEGVKVYTDVNKQDEIIVDVNVRYAGDANIKCTVKGINFGIKSLRIYGNLRCVINPLISDVPIIGGLTVFFLNCPEVTFDMTAAANILDLPVIKKTIKDIVCNVLSDLCVLPRRIPIALHGSVDSTMIKYPPPEGLVIIHMVECKALKSADINIIGKGKSDPYCTIGG